MVVILPTHTHTHTQSNIPVFEKWDLCAKYLLGAGRLIRAPPQANQMFDVRVLCLCHYSNSFENHCFRCPLETKHLKRTEFLQGRRRHQQNPNKKGCRQSLLNSIYILCVLYLFLNIPEPKFSILPKTLLV